MRMKKYSAFAKLYVLQCCFVWSLHAQNPDSRVTNSLEFALQQLSNTVIAIGDTIKYPRSTLEDGSWKTKDSGSWTSGFFPGCLWYMYEWTSDNTWRGWAGSWTAGLEKEKNDTSTHDVGFKIFCSFGNGYRLSGNEAYREVIIRAAQSLSTRFNPTVGCIRSWNNRTFPVIIDNIMNLEILFWASKNGGKSEWYDMAVSHALRTIEDHVREDGSTYQVVDYNPSTGEVIKKETVQGYSVESTWSRGQAWGLYGFTLTFRETGDIRFLETAQRLADYFIKNLPEDHVPYWDFEAPNIPSEEKDASAAAIAASGLLELSSLVSGAEQQDKYRNAAFDIIASLASSAYLAESTNSRGILLHGVGNRNKNSEVDVSLIYADYYFIEALLRYQSMITSVNTFDDRERAIPTTVELFQNYPNPFNPETTIIYRLPWATFVTLRIYDITGRLVKEFEQGYQRAGNHRFHFTAKNLYSGMYLFLLQAGAQTKSVKMTLVR